MGRAAATANARSRAESGGPEGRAADLGIPARHARIASPTVGTARAIAPVSATPQATAMPYLYANDVVAKIAEVVAAGGQKVGEPMSMPGMATFGYFLDPSGTAVGLIGP